ncbi:hypothetical protein [Bradyrhizobium erythrophlei]|uniref:YfhO family protein n=1 Tax=Bradyrhizobium erythrophlei TaxID=1437360 RepID=A0A1M7UCF5_9BRAD|nr:hypothetical protein [Bradyrhizobium erythrophlei]SHN80673.1 hypothetical protein SAMN05444170_4466 [Bradyrhizobium erythrophlei]
MTRPDDNRALDSELAIAAVFVSTIWVVAILHWIAKDAVIPWDSKNQFYAFFRFLSETLHSGELPFWNPYHYGGHPSVADPQSLIFSPVFAAWAAIDRFPTMRAFDIVVQAHLLLGGLAIVFIGWRARWSIASCVLAATLFMLGGPASGRLQHTGIILSYSAFPVALLFLQLGLERRSYILALGFSVVAVGMALGRNQVALLLCALLISAAVAEILGAQKSMRYLRERGGVLALMIVAGGALLFIPLLLTAQFAILSNRPSEGLDEALRGSLYPANFATVAIPNIFGTHSAYWGPGAATSADVDLTDDSENYLFLGGVPTFVLLWLGVAGRRAWQPGRRLMACALVISCLFMLGRYTPLYSLGFRFIPAIDLFRRPTDASFVFAIAAAFLAGHCLTDYVRNGMPHFRIVSTLLALLVSLAIAVSAVEFSARTGHAADATHEALVSLALMLAAGLFLFAARSAPARAGAAIVVTLAAATELTWWNTASRLNAEPWNFYAVLEAPSGANAATIALLEQSIEADHRRGDYPRVEVLGLGGPWQNLAMVRGWEATNGYNPLRIGSYDRLVSPGEQNWDVSQRQFPRSFDNYSCSLAKALGLTYLILGSALQDLPGLSILPSSELLLSGPPIWLYRIQGASPRVSMVSEFITAAPRVDLPFSRTDYDSPPGIGAPPDRSPALPPPAGALPGKAKIELLAPGRLGVVTTSTTAAFLLVHDLFYPGWVAEIDGKRTPMVRADVLFRAVEVPAGMHHVTFSFAPFSSENLKGALADALSLRAAPR